MQLKPWERDYYVISYETNPPLTGTLAASFDGDAWINGTATTATVDGEEVDAWAWLIAGPDWVAEGGEDEADTDFTMDATRVIPRLKLVDAPVTDGKSGPPIDVKT